MVTHKHVYLYVLCIYDFLLESLGQSCAYNYRVEQAILSIIIIYVILPMFVPNFTLPRERK